MNLSNSPGYPPTNRRTVLAGAVLAPLSVAGCVETPAPNGAVVTETPRTDQPLHDPTEPTIEPGDDPDEVWDPTYLCAGMETTPSQPFEVHHGGVQFEDAIEEYPPDMAYLARAYTSEAAVSDLHTSREEAATFIEGVDFDEEVLIVVQSGWGSSSVRHDWRRIEETTDGLSVHGCYRKPHIQTSDWTTRYSLIKTPTPEADPVVRVSLTVDVDTRVHFNTTEGIVGIES